MIKLRMFIRFEKEEKWLEKMLEQGWLLRSSLFFYDFVKTEPRQGSIKIDYRDFTSKQDYLDYCTMFEDSGWQHIAGSQHSGTQYFLKMREDCTEDIFSDACSRAGRYKRIAGMWLTMAIIYFPLLVTNNGWEEYSILAPKTWYLTPGIWELEGIRFWCAFLFETPFALMRGLPWVFPGIAMLLFLILTVKAWRLAHKAEKGE